MWRETLNQVGWGIVGLVMLCSFAWTAKTVLKRLRPAWRRGE